MRLVGNPDELAKKKAYLAPLVERLGNMPGALSMVNNRGEDALYLAAMNCPEMPYVTGYLAAAMVQKRIDITQRLYHIRVSLPRDSSRLLVARIKSQLTGSLVAHTIAPALIERECHIRITYRTGLTVCSMRACPAKLLTWKLSDGRFQRAPVEGSFARDAL